MVRIAAQDRERQEKDFWSTSATERPGADSLDVLTNKMSEARVFLEKLRDYAELFGHADTIVELGGGQCWASCMLKHELGPRATVIGTDIGPDAVASVERWEQILGARLDGVAACRSYQTPFADASVDLVFVFAAAHHFGAHASTLRELARILTPGGHALYLHEPGCRDWIYPLAYRRVTAKRPVVPEDILRYRHIVDLAARAGLDVEVRHSPTTTYRGAKETVYYLGLQMLAPLQDLLPCTVDLVITRPQTVDGAGPRHP